MFVRSLFRAVAVAVVLAPVVGAQAKPANPAIGTWVLDVAKSKYPAGTAPKSQTLVYAEAKDGYTVKADGVGPDGKPQQLSQTVVFDGKPHPASGNGGFDAASYKSVDATTVEFTRYLKGKQVATGKRTMSKDGKTLTIETTTTGADGKASTSVAVYSRK